MANSVAAGHFVSLVLTSLAIHAPEALSQGVPPPDRDSLAAALAKAEQTRARYSLESSITYHYEVDGLVDQRTVTRRLADGSGKFRRERWKVKPGRSVEQKELSCWDGKTGSSDGYRVDNQGRPHYVAFAPETWGNNYLDEIESVLGIAIAEQISARSPRLSPSAAISNPDTPLTIESISSGGQDLVRVRIVGPWGGEGNGYIYDFDPDRQWLVTRLEIHVYQTAEQRRSDESRNIMMYTTTQAEQIDGVWMPRQVEMLTRMAEHAGPDALWEEYRATLRLDSITLHPEFTDDDFRISLVGMPDGTSVADARLGISYKLGQNLLYADGVLHELDAPIDHELNASEAEALLASSRPMIDPELANINLKSVGGNGLAWAGRIAGGLTVAMCVGIGFVLYRRRA